MVYFNVFELLPFFSFLSSLDLLVPRSCLRFPSSRRPAIPLNLLMPSSVCPRNFPASAWLPCHIFRGGPSGDYCFAWSVTKLLANRFAFAPISIILASTFMTYMEVVILYLNNCLMYFICDYFLLLCSSYVYYSVLICIIVDNGSSIFQDRPYQGFLYHRYGCGENFFFVCYVPVQSIPCPDCNFLAVFFHFRVSVQS